MLSVLLTNWRALAAVLFMLAELLAGWKLHHMGYETGRAEVQAEFTLFKEQALEAAMAAQAERTAAEKRMADANQKVTENYESLKDATAVAVRALDADRVRLQATLAAYRGATGKDPAPGACIDGDALVRSFSECVDRYSAVASELDQTSDTLKALQAYVRDVVPQ